MDGSSICPCSACYNADPSEDPHAQPAAKPVQTKQKYPTSNTIMGRMRLALSVHRSSTSSDLVALREAAQPVAVTGK